MNASLNHFFKDFFLKKSAVIFDFDGTIADTLPIHEKAFQEALKNHQLAFKYKDYSGISTYDAISRIFQGNGLEIKKNELEELVRLKRKLANKLYRSAIRFIPGADIFIETLFKKGYQLYIASSGSKTNIMSGMQSLQIEKYFTDIITADDVQYAKPNPTIFISLINKYKIPAHQVIVIEDSPAGLLAAQRAGIDAVCIDKSVQQDEISQTGIFYYNFFELITVLEDDHRE